MFERRGFARHFSHAGLFKRDRLFSSGYASVQVSFYDFWCLDASVSSVDTRGVRSNSWPDHCPFRYNSSQLPYRPPSTTHSSTSLYALSNSSFTTTLSCTPSSFANVISASACSNRFCIASSLSVPLPLNLLSNTSIDGGERKRNRAFRCVRFTCLTPCGPCLVSAIAHAPTGDPQRKPEHDRPPSQYPKHRSSPSPPHHPRPWRSSHNDSPQTVHVQWNPSGPRAPGTCPSS